MKPSTLTSDDQISAVVAPTLRLCNEPRPDVSLLAVVWPAGDPARSEWPTVIDDWLRDWDDALEGTLTQACGRADFGWALSTHLWIDTRGRLPFSSLLLVGATPRSEAEWPGWTDIGAGLGQLVASRPVPSVGLVVDRIFAPGLGELATGFFGALGDGDTVRELVVTGSIDWTDADGDAVRSAWEATSAG